ncbi:hypothetical protein SCUCBS95973_008844 [Sporothrix curviconia]|uniref:NmrA-like domain-containing protein n=1 Tax=Sporothrix curviconia TaxID=1260050 RepID=A0ABP0CPX7_9PEZI
MVKVIVAGVNSGLGLEVIDALSEGKHKVLSLGKLEIQKYLANLNKDKQVLEYTLFQIGQLFEYVAGFCALSKQVSVNQFKTAVDDTITAGKGPGRGAYLCMEQQLLVA